MISLRAIRFPLAFAILSAVALAGACYFAFQSGCAGDLKGGALGDPILALYLSNISFALQALGLVLGAFAIASCNLLSGSERLNSAIAFVFLFAVLAWMAGVQLEAMGVEACLLS